jgi:Flp pilus assembly pilin Flp
MRRSRIRRGVSAVQWIVLAAVITLAIVATITVLGTRTNNKLNQTATDVADPASLVNRFGS